MSDVGVKLSGSLPQQLDSLISNSVWMRTQEGSEIFIYALQEEKHVGAFI